MLNYNAREFLGLARAREGWGKGENMVAKIFRRRSEGAAGGRGEGEESRRTRALGWEAARPCESKEAKPAKIDSIDSLIEKSFCARTLKDLSIFAGFVRRQAASRWVGCRAAGAALVSHSVQNRFGFGHRP
jgi:hypothetical protein